LYSLADGGGIEPLSSFPLFYATSLEDLCGYTAYYIKKLRSSQLLLYPIDLQTL